MNRINIKSINFDALKPLPNIMSSESNIYFDNKKIYKIYKSLNKFELSNKKLKMYMLEGYNLNNVVIPETEIVKGNRLVGCSEEYIKNSTSLFDFEKKSDDINKFLQIVKEATLTLKQIHGNEIIVADLSFDNIIFDDNYNHYYIDFENVSLNNLPFERTPLMTQVYYDFRGSEYEINYNYDRLSMLLCTIETIVGKNLETITDYEFDNLSERLQFFRNLKPLYKQLKKRYTPICEIPYIDELIVKEKNMEYKMPKLV